jgi:acetyl-CoA carboxylase biotin carboxyl carrier protein
MNDQNKTEPTGVAPAREPQQREGFSQQSDQQRAASLNSVGGRRGSRRRHREREGQPQTSHTRPEASLNMDELRELFELISAQGFTEFELEKEGFRVRLRRDFSSGVTTAGAHGGGGHSDATPSQSAHSMSFAPQQGAHVTTGSGSAAATSAQTNVFVPETAEASPVVELFDITSPIVGTFYRSPSPASEPFVKIGSHVDSDTVVCIVEAMKLMNEIQAEATGTIEKIYVENGQPVEFGQPLFGIRK